MTVRRQFLIWVAVAVAAILFLTAILEMQRRSAATRWTTFLVGDPRIGLRIFHEKGCSDCHAIFGGRGETEKIAPDLGIQRSAGAGLNQLVTQMWNHAPRMWNKIRESKKPFPTFNEEEMTHLFAYLYATCYLDESGNSRRGRALFSQKGCSRCHSFEDDSSKIGPNLRKVRWTETPLFWAQEMWNHATVMEAEVRAIGLPWPRFNGTEMNDLLAYVREEQGGSQRERELLPADSRRGWSLFKKKKCITCHAIRGQGGRLGPDLASTRVLLPTVSQVAGQMWNHSPQMIAAMKEKGFERPIFEGQEMADLFAFLFSLGSFEIGGSPIIGRELFVERKCSSCHGSEAEGSKQGPALRKPATIYTPVTLAQALWLHGPRMYKKAQELGPGWPQLKQEDLDHLLAFLNSAPEKAH